MEQDGTTHLKLLPEALFDLVRGLRQFAQLPNPTLDLSRIDTSSVQGLRGGKMRQDRNHNQGMLLDQFVCELHGHERLGERGRERTCFS